MNPQLDVFDAVLATPTRHIRDMVHTNPSDEEQLAATGILRVKSALHDAVLHALATYGALNDRELEQLPEFRQYGPSTIRKRRSELFQRGAVVKVGTREKLALWMVAGERPYTEDH